jgi:hypothetical protein
MLNIEKVSLGNSEVHLIGAQHGYPFFGELISGPTEIERKRIQQKLWEFKDRSPILVFEGWSKKQLRFWEKVVGINLSEFDKFYGETFSSAHISGKAINKQKRKVVWDQLKKLSVGKRIAAITGYFVFLPVLMGAGLTIVAIPKTRKALVKILSGGEVDRGRLKGRAFRDFVQSTIIKEIAARTNAPIVCLQGRGHTAGVKRFLEDEVYYNTFKGRLKRMAPRANILFEKIKRKKQGQIERRTRRGKK